MLQRAGKLRFQTLYGVLEQGDDHLRLLTDDQAKYQIEAGRMTASRLDHLIGARVEVRGLVEPLGDSPPKIHVIYLKG